MSDALAPPLRHQLAGIDPRTELAVFAPKPAQARAKARLHAQLAAAADRVDLASLTATEVAALAGNVRVVEWLRDPAFAAWLADKDTYAYQALALRETAVAVLDDILTADYEPKILTAKDKLKAVDMLFQLTGSYPAKEKAIRFADAGLDGMSADQVKAEIAALKAKVRELPG
jgi:hypothetical protein